MNEELKRTIYTSIYDFIYWDGCNNLLSTRLPRDFKKTQLSLDESLQSSPWYFNKSTDTLQFKLYRLLRNLYNGHDINISGNEITLEKVLFQIHGLQKDLPEFSDQLENMELRIKIMAVIVCLREENFTLGLDIFRRQKLSSYLQMNDVSSEDKSNITTIEQILRVNDVHHPLLQEFNYGLFLDDCLHVLKLIFQTIPDPHLIKLFSQTSTPLNGTNTNENGAKDARKATTKPIRKPRDLRVREHRCNLTKENKLKLFEVCHYLVKRGSLSKKTREEMKTVPPYHEGGTDLITSTQKRLKYLGVLDMFAKSDEHTTASVTSTPVPKTRLISSANVSTATKSKKTTPTRKLRPKKMSPAPTPRKKPCLNSRPTGDLDDASDDETSLSSENVYPIPFPGPDVTLTSHYLRRTSSTLTPERKRVSIPPSPSGRRKRKRWTENEEEQLYFGVRKYGVGNWHMILTSTSEYSFNDRKHIDLSDKWRNMQKPKNKERLKELEKIYRVYLKGD